MNLSTYTVYLVLHKISLQSALRAVAVTAASKEDAVSLVMSLPEHAAGMALCVIEGSVAEPGFPWSDIQREESALADVEQMATLLPVQYPLTDGKMFLAFWSSGAFVRSGYMIVPASRFSLELGYEQHELEAIAALEVGNVYDSHDYGHLHSIKRIA